MERTTMNTKEAADYLGVSPSTVGRWVKHYGLPALKLKHSGRILFKKDRIDAWLNKQMDGEKDEDYKTYGNLRVLQP